MIRLAGSLNSFYTSFFYSSGYIRFTVTHNLGSTRVVAAPALHDAYANPVQLCDIEYTGATTRGSHYYIVDENTIYYDIYGGNFGETSFTVSLAVYTV